MKAEYTLNGYTILTARDTWPIRIPNYRGACRGLWWPLREHQDESEAARRLSDALDDELLGNLAPSQPHAIVDAELLQGYANAAEALGLRVYGLVSASPVGRGHLPNWTGALQTSCEHLGIDVCYPNGSYSFLSGAYSSQREELLEFTRANLNSNGLLSDAASAGEFLRRYRDEMDKGANFEPLDDALPVELWHDPDLISLKRLFNG